jgi:hypothetical protein
MTEQTDRWNKVLQRTMIDPQYREHLKADPAKTLAAAGLEVDPTKEYIVLEETPHKVYLLLPPLKKAGELSEEALDVVAGGEGEPPGPLPQAGDWPPKAFGGDWPPKAFGGDWPHK